MIIDTLRSDHLSCYGYEGIRTTNLDSLAKEGMIFTNAVCQVPLTLPSHCSIFTGKYPTAHGVRHNGLFQLDPSEITLAEVLRENEFETAAFVGSFVLNSDYGLDQGFQTYSDIKIPHKDMSKMREVLEKKKAPERVAEDVNKDFFQWLPSVKDKRFFAWIHYYDPHLPYEPPEESGKKLEGEGYDREISYSDQCVGDLLMKLKEMSLLDNSIILFCSDHGEGLGEHGELTHGLFIYDYSMRIPLIIRAPWMIKRDTAYEGLFETIDIMPTLLDLLGIALPSTIQGESFAKNILTGKLLDGKEESYAETYMPTFGYGCSDLKSIRRRGTKYIEAPIPEMYNLIDDPKELTNLYSPSDEESAELKEDLEDLLSRITPAESDPYDFKNINEEEIEALKSLGYLSGDYFKEGKIDPDQERIDPKLAIEEINTVQEGKSLMAEGQFKDALAVFQNTRAKNPKIYQARLYIIKIYIAMEEFNKAEAEALKAVQIAELDETAMRAMGSQLWNMYGFLLEKKNDLEGAEKAYRKDFEINAHSEKSFAFLANFYISHKETDKAIEIIEEKLAINPDNVLANTMLFKIYMERNNVSQATQIAKKLVHYDLSDDIQTLHLAAHALRMGGMIPESIAAFEQILEIQPGDKDTLGNLGNFYFSLEEYEKAREKFEEMLRIDPGEFMAHFYMGMIALKRNDEEEARKRFEKVLSQKPTYYPVYDVLGSWLKEKGRIEEAREEFKKALTLNPEDQLALQGLKSINQ